MVTNSDWLAAGIAVAAGFLIGSILGWLVRRLLSAPKAREELRSIANPSGIFIFWFSVAVGVVIAMGIVSPGSLDSIPTQILQYLPQILSAGIIVLSGYAIAVALGQLASRTLGAATGAKRHSVDAVTRFAVMSATLILALAQLGVDVTILTILVAAVAFGVAGASALLVGLGGKTVASALAAGRYVRRYVDVGSRVEVADVRGTVAALHEATMEIRTDEGRTVHMPYSAVLEAGSVIERPSDH